MKLVGDYIYSDFKNLNWESFYDIIWTDFISEKTVGTAWMDENEEFVTEITIEFFRLFKMSNKINIRLCAKMIEIFMTSMFNLKPGQENKNYKKDFNFF